MIGVVGYLSVDVITSGGGVRVQRGGPGLFAYNVLRGLNHRMKLCLRGGRVGTSVRLPPGVQGSPEAPGEPYEISLPNRDGEAVPIVKVPQDFTPFGAEAVLSQCVGTDALLISSVLDDFETSAVGEIRASYRGLIVIDVQGFQRGLDLNSGRLLRRTCPRDVLESADVCKLTAAEAQRQFPQGEEEMRAFSSEHRSILIVTSGAAAIRVFDSGREFSFVPRALRVGLSVGAGDTFLAAFCAFYLDRRDVQGATEAAMNETARFLSFAQ